MASPMASPLVPPSSPPMPMNSAPSTASRTAVFIAFLMFRSPRGDQAGPGTAITLGGGSTFPARGSVVVAGVEIDAGDALGAEHLDVAAVVLDREPEIEPVAPQVPHRRLLEVARIVVVAPRAHDEQVPSDLVAAQ